MSAVSIAKDGPCNYGGRSNKGDTAEIAHLTTPCWDKGRIAAGEFIIVIGGKSKYGKSGTNSRTTGPEDVPA